MKCVIVVAAMSLLATGAIAQPTPELIRSCGKKECRALYGLEKGDAKADLAPGTNAKIGFKKMDRRIFDNMDTVGDEVGFSAFCYHRRVTLTSADGLTAGPPVAVGRPIGQYTADEVKAVFDWVCHGKYKRPFRLSDQHEPD